MAGDEDSGGVQGLRAWAMDATGRAARLIGRNDENQTVTAEEFEGSVAELLRLRTLLDHDRLLLGKVTLVLGSLLAVRHASGRGTADDRERARLLLEEVRDPARPAGERMADDDRQWAAMFLLMVSPHVQPGATAPSPPDLWSLLDLSAASLPGQPAAEAARIAALAAEVGRIPTLPPEVHQKLNQTQDLLSYLEKGDLSDPEALLLMLPPGFPLSDELRSMLETLSPILREAAPPAPEPGAKKPAPEPAAQEPAPEPGAEEPAAEAADRTETAVTHAWLTAMIGLPEALRTGDPGTLDRVLERLGGQLDRLPADDAGAASGIQALMRMVLQTAGPLGGSRFDDAEALRQTGPVVEHFAQWAADDPRVAHIAVMARAVGLFTRMRSEEGENVDEFRRLMGELDALEASMTAGDPAQFAVALVHGSALVLLGERTRDSEAVSRGLAQQEAALASRPDGGTGVPDAQLDALLDGIRASRAVADRLPDLMPGSVPSPADSSAGTQYLRALTAAVRHTTNEDPTDLAAAISGLEHVRDEVRQGRMQHVAFAALWQLAECYRWRLRSTQDPADRDAATAAALESLRALAGDVVLQSGSHDALLTARSGSEYGMRAAVWAASQGRVEEAVAALELGRALVLQAASTSRAVPELLEAGGHQDLAREWRAAQQGPGGAAGALPRELPSSLRRRALWALGHRERDGSLFRTPTVDELKAGVAEGDADALVYLLAGEGASPGMAVVLGPDIGTGVRAMPLLSGENSAPLERYLDAAAAYQQQPHVPEALRTWEEALSELCDWATDAVIFPVLTGVAERLAANESRRTDRPGPPRIVLVPCGRLGIVPWHAARLPAGSRRDWVCQIMIISYAASGRQFLSTVRRARSAPASAPVMVADPTMSLPFAELEVTGLQQTLYPRARLYGAFYTPPAGLVATGTPDDILAALAGGPSLLHVACHGSAGTSPTASALRLAPGPGEEGRSPTELLTVSRLLDRVAGEQDCPEGPLVVLSACETDLSRRDHDEALTLTTAFVASGARDVVGSRWATRDSAAALMMAVFHHYLAVEGLSPVDALHGARMWMLDPERENPGSLSDELVRELAGAPELDRPAAWAAFIHQGHPGPARTPRRG
ncbi:CHAT domain-containing protein [Streptomyces sp. NBC_01335]|uniref:CHAT domain-containing protein n=1 Tax=Streptomyces sp. NBC_01335 TaxID=2903828 RepID=UPI002E105C01|nr:CHAT domain-containing protein [Streptomyces sp. NBC_01335]